MNKRRPNDTTLDKCAFHFNVLSTCNNELSANSYFSKTVVLRSLGYEGIAAAIYWDYIRRKIEDPINGTGVQLLPVSSLFFKRHKKGHPLNSLLAGPGGKAAGFVYATYNHGEIALLNGELRHNQSKGMVVKSRKRAEEISQQLFDQGDTEPANKLRGSYGLPPIVALPVPEKEK